MTTTTTLPEAKTDEDVFRHTNLLISGIPEDNVTHQFTHELLHTPEKRNPLLVVHVDSHFSPKMEVRTTYVIDPTRFADAFSKMYDIIKSHGSATELRKVS